MLRSRTYEKVNGQSETLKSRGRSPRQAKNIGPIQPSVLPFSAMGAASCVLAELDMSGSKLAADDCLALANARQLHTLDLSGTAVAESAASLEANQSMYEIYPALPDVLRLFPDCCPDSDTFAVALVSRASRNSIHELHGVRFKTPLSACVVSIPRLAWARQCGLRATDIECLVAAAHTGVIKVCQALLTPELKERISILYAQSRPPAEVIRAAATGGHVHVIEWARAQGLGWDASCTAAAAFAGNLEMLQWLRAHSCPWDKNCTARAAVEGHTAVLRWAKDNGCEYSEETVLRMKMAKAAAMWRFM
jgi:hypothetical protein